MGITRGDGTVVPHPSADTVLRAGDRVKLFGLPEQIEALLAYGVGGDGGERRSGSR